MNINPLAPDAPLLSLLSARENPMLNEASEEQLVTLVKRLRMIASSPQTLAALDNEAGRAVTPKKSVVSAKRAILDSL